MSRLAVGVFTLGLAAMSCHGLVRHPVYVAQSPSALVEVDAPPPPARVELVPSDPGPGTVWVDGEWTWRRGRWAWVPGRWVRAAAGSSFAPWVFVRGEDGRLWYAPGQWQSAAGTPMDPPDALAIASVETGVVVTAEGETEVTGPTVRRRPRAAASAEPAAK